MTAKVIVTCHLILLSGCCWVAKRDCFPPCDPPKLVEVVKPCELPAPVILEPFKRAECPDPKLVCFTAPEAAKLAGNVEALKTWVVQVRARCGAPASAPASLPQK